MNSRNSPISYKTPGNVLQQDLITLSLLLFCETAALSSENFCRDEKSFS